MVDPVTLTGLALAGLAGAGASAAIGGGSSPAPTATPQAAPPPPPTSAAPAQSPQGKPGGGQSAQPSFIGSTSVPSGESGQKTLVGQ